MPKSKPAFIEVKCPKCGKQFNSEKEMLKHYDEHHDIKEDKLPQRKLSRKKVLLTVAIIAILVVGSFAFLINWSNEQASKTKDSDGDGIIDWYEVNVFHTDPDKIDTSGLGLDDFNAIYTYNIDPNNQTAVNEFLNLIPNVTANIWDIRSTDGVFPDGVYRLNSFTFSELYDTISLRDPLIKYLASRSEIKWRENSIHTDIFGNTIGTLYVDGSKLQWNIQNESFCPQPSYYFTHGRARAIIHFG